MYLNIGSLFLTLLFLSYATLNHIQLFMLFFLIGDIVKSIKIPISLEYYFKQNVSIVITNKTSTKVEVTFLIVTMPNFISIESDKEKSIFPNQFILILTHCCHFIRRVRPTIPRLLDGLIGIESVLSFLSLFSITFPCSSLP